MQNVNIKLWLLSFSLLILSVTLIRPVNIDEAYYLISAHEVINGKLLYKDFIFHQMPFTLYLYSLISDHGIWSLIFGRIISALLITASCIILLNLLKLKSLNITFVLFVFFYFLNSFFVDWAVLIRIYSLSVFLFSVGLYYVFKYITVKNHSGYIIISSLAFTLLVFTKISFIINYLIYITFIIYFSNKKDYFRKITLILVSSIFPFLLFLLLYGKSLNEFYFNVFNVNFITKEHIDSSFLPGLIKFLGFFLLPQNFILLMIVLFSGFKFSIFEKFIIINIAGFVLIHVFTRMLPEYLCSITPLLSLLAVLRYSKFIENVIFKFKKLTFKYINLTVLFLYFISIPFGIMHIKNIFEGTELLMNPVQLIGFENRINSLQGSKILSSWEGYSFFSGKEPILIDQYGSVFISRFIDNETIAKYHIAVRNDYSVLLRDQIPDIVVYDNLNSAQLDGLKDLLNSKYRKTFEYKKVEVFSR